MTMPFRLFTSVAMFDAYTRPYLPQQRPETSTIRLHHAIMQGNLNIQQPRGRYREAVVSSPMRTITVCVDWKSQKKEWRNCETATRVQCPADQTVFNNRKTESSQKLTHAQNWKLVVCRVRTGRNSKGSRNTRFLPAMEVWVENPTYLLTPRSRVLLEKLIGLQPVKKFPAC